MEGGAKGQVGGMEMGEAERKRLAEESKVWRCAGCGGKTNDDILKAQEEEAGETAESSQSDIPEELRFGFKDEMKSEKDESTQEPIVAAASAVTTAIPAPRTAATPNVSKSSTLGQPASSPPATQIASPPSSSAALSMPQQPAVRIQPSTQVSSQEAIPGWIDKAIVGLVATLLVLIVKKVMA